MPAGPILKRCPGCLKRFTSVRAHLAQTLNPLCRRLVKKKKSSHPGPAPISTVAAQLMQKWKLVSATPFTILQANFPQIQKRLPPSDALSEWGCVGFQMGQIGPSVGPSHQAGFPRMLPARDLSGPRPEAEVLRNASKGLSAPGRPRSSG